MARTDHQKNKKCKKHKKNAILKKLKKLFKKLINKLIEQGCVLLKWLAVLIVESFVTITIEQLISNGTILDIFNRIPL